jgi:hypothetical protein
MATVTLGQLHRMSGKAISRIRGIVAITDKGSVIALLHASEDALEGERRSAASRPSGGDVRG